MSLPLVSIIVPNYNHKPYLKHRIESIINQTFQDFEILIFDDASQDGSLELLNTYKTHPKVSHFIVNSKNSGSPFVQWRKGIELAQGDYIWIAETDDFAEPTFLAETVKVLKNKQEVSLVYTDSKIVNDKDEPIGFWSESKNVFFNTKKWSNNHDANGFDEVLDFLLYKVTINNASAVLFRKKQLLEMNLETLERFKNAGDLYTYCNVLFKGNISYIALPLNNYRTHALNATKTNTNSGVFYIDALNCYNFVIKAIIKDPRSNLKKLKIENAVKFILNRFGFQLVDSGYYKDLKHFILNLSNDKILPQGKAKILQYAYKLYTKKHKNMKSVAKRIIKINLS